jgi:hypothetical protein
MLHALSPGQDLLAAVSSLFHEQGVSQGWARVCGSVAGYRLAVADGAHERTVEWKGSAHVVSCDVAWRGSGPHAGASTAWVVLAMDVGGVPTVRAGRLVSAQILSADAWLATNAAAPPPGRARTAEEVAASRPAAMDEGEDDAPIRPVAPTRPPEIINRPQPAAAAPARPAPLPAAPAPRPIPAPAPSGPPAGGPSKPASWADVADISARLKAAGLEEDDDEIDPDDLQAGDRLHHPVLGEIRIKSVVGDSAIMVVGRDGRPRKMTLTPFEVRRRTDGSYELQHRKGRD